MRGCTFFFIFFKFIISIYFFTLHCTGTHIRNVIKPLEAEAGFWWPSVNQRDGVARRRLAKKVGPALRLL